GSSPRGECMRRAGGWGLPLFADRGRSSSHPTGRGRIGVPAARPPMTDRRAAPRFRPAHGTVCRLDATVGLVWDLSTSGVSILVADPPKPGEYVAGELTGEAD